MMQSPRHPNFARVATSNQICQSSSSHQDIEVCFVARVSEIYKLKEDAPELCCKDLLECLCRAKANGDAAAAAEIIHIHGS